MTNPRELRADWVLVDTNVFSFIFRRDPRADIFRPYLVNRTPALSFMSVAELYFGAYKANWGQASISRLETAMRNYVVLPYDHAVAQLWARVRQQRERRGRPIGVADAWTAACALAHGCAVATADRDFSGIDGLTVIQPS